MASKKGKSLSQEEVIATFQRLRTEQQTLIAKISEIEGDKNEHRIVLETLRGVDPDRKCFRMVGGVLVERTAKEVIPALEHNFENMSALIAKLMEEVAKKGQELVTFKQKHGLKLMDERESSSGGGAPAIKTDTTATAGGASKGSTAATQGVLVPK